MNDDDFNLTPEERRAYQRSLTGAADKAKDMSFWGSLIGGGAGAAAGLISGGSLSPALMSAGNSIGGAIGNWLGNQQGQEIQNKAAKEFEAMLEKKRAPDREKEERMKSLGLINSWLTTRGM